MDVETDISENLLSRIALGQPAEVSVSAIPSKRYRGRLRQVLPMGDRTRGTVKVKVEILDPDDKLFPELAATVHFLPSQDREQPRRRPVLPLRAQVGAVPGERPRPRLGHRRRATSTEAAGRGRRHHRRPGAGRVGPRSTASRSSSTRSRRCTTTRSCASPSRRGRRGRQGKAERRWAKSMLRSSCAEWTRNIAATSSSSPCW